MPTFRATLERGTRRRPVEAIVDGDHLVLRTPDGREGRWSITELRLARSLEGVELTIDGERARLVVAQPEAFWQAVAGGEDPTWWKFWSARTWSAWWRRRRAWNEYRDRATSLDARIASAAEHRERAAAEAGAAGRRLEWIRQLGPREVPIRTARTETGLATVADVTLLETRRREGQTVWRAVDLGDVHFTDRRMVFSGAKNVEFRYDAITIAGQRPEGLYLAVSNRKRDHILAGPAERLEVVLDACRKLAAGIDPVAEATEEVTRTVEQLETADEQLADLRAERNSLVRPDRPVSPAWVPSVAAAALLFALGAYADDPDLPDTPPPTTVTTVTTTPTTTSAPPSTSSTSTTTTPPTTSTTTTTTTTSTTTTAPPTTTTAAAAGAPAAEGEMAVYFFDVGQGDSTLLAGPDFTVVIDAGRHDRTDVVPHLRRAGVESIDLLVGTHPDADHIGQLADVLAAFPVTEVWMSGDQHTTLTFERALDAILDSEAGYHEPRAGETFEIGSAVVEVLNPASVGGDLNDGSIVLRVTFGEVRFLFTGDAEAGAEAAMLGRGHDLAADVLHVGHHGSAASTTEPFLAAVSPRIAVYSAGAGNQYGHPSPEVLQRLADHGVEVYGTDVNGTVVVTTDGRSITVDTTGGGTGPLPAPTTTTTSTTTSTAPATTAPHEEETASACEPWQVDINHAPPEELERIIHIGPERAGQILQLRPFSSVDSMIRIKGIGEKRLADIKAQGIACAG